MHKPMTRSQRVFCAVILFLVLATLAYVIQNQVTVSSCGVSPMPDDCQQHFRSLVNSPRHSNHTAPLRVPCHVEEALKTIQQKTLTRRPTPTDFQNLPLVTGFSRNHFAEARDAVASMQVNVPGHSIHVFDLGLSKWQVRELLSWCNVTYHKFEFHRYPQHLCQRLGSCAWKPIIILEMLVQHNALFYFDASIRARCSHMLKDVQQVALKSGLAVLEAVGHSTFAATHANMYKYLTVNWTSIYNQTMLGAGFLMLVNTKEVFDNILRWWIRCSLNKDCIDPDGSRPSCEFHPKDRYKTYANCHRFDQSALNLLLEYHSGGNVSKYLSSRTCAAVIRSVTHKYTLRTCNSS